MRCYQNLLGNTLVTNNKPPLPLANPKEKNQAPLSLLIGCLKFVFPKQFVTIFTLNTTRLASF
jgi:hypothetical protein